MDVERENVPERRGGEETGEERRGNRWKGKERK